MQTQFTLKQNKTKITRNTKKFLATIYYYDAVENYLFKKKKKPAYIHLHQIVLKSNNQMLTEEMSQSEKHNSNHKQLIVLLPTTNNVTVNSS